MTPGHKDDFDGRRPGLEPPERSASGTMPRIRPMTGGGAVVGPGHRSSATMRAVGGALPVARARYEGPARVVSGARTFDGRIELIGPADVVVALPVGLADGERVSTRFTLPMSQKVVSVPTGVARREPHAGGLEAVTLTFTIIDEALRKELDGYVKLMQR